MGGDEIYCKVCVGNVYGPVGYKWCKKDRRKKICTHCNKTGKCRYTCAECNPPSFSESDSNYSYGGGDYSASLSREGYEYGTRRLATTSDAHFLDAPASNRIPTLVLLSIFLLGILFLGWLMRLHKVSLTCCKSYRASEEERSRLPRYEPRTGRFTPSF